MVTQSKSIEKKSHRLPSSLGHWIGNIEFRLNPGQTSARIEINGRKGLRGQCSGGAFTLKGHNYSGYVLELDLTIKTDEVPLSYFYRSNHVIYRQIRWKKPNISTGYVYDHEVGTIVFNPSELSCNKRIEVVGSSFKLYRADDIDVYLVNSQNETLMVNLKDQTRRLCHNYYAQATNIKDIYFSNITESRARQLKPDKSGEILNHQLFTFSGISILSKSSDHNFVLISNDLCRIKTLLAKKFPDFHLQSHYNDNSLKYDVVTLSNRKFYYECEKVEVKISQNLTSCYKDLPVTYNNKSFFLNSKLKLIRRSQIRSCNSAVPRRYKIMKDTEIVILSGGPRYTELKAEDQVNGSIFKLDLVTLSRLKFANLFTQKNFLDYQLGIFNDTRLSVETKQHDNWESGRKAVSSLADKFDFISIPYVWSLLGLSKFYLQIHSVLEYLENNAERIFIIGNHIILSVTLLIEVCVRSRRCNSAVLEILFVVFQMLFPAIIVARFVIHIIKTDGGTRSSEVVLLSAAPARTRSPGSPGSSTTTLTAHSAVNCDGRQSEKLPGEQV